MAPAPAADLALTDAERRREQRSWYWYDWANSAFYTTTLTALFSPYLREVAQRAACPGLGADQTCETDLSVLGVPVSPGSLGLYTITAATLVSALLLPVVGAMVDRSGKKRTVLAVIAWTGAAAASSMVFVGGTRWVLGVVLAMIASLSGGCSLVVYDSILIDISTPDERDAVSSRGWALGYLGGGLLLAVNLVLVSAPGLVGLTLEWAVRVSLLSAGLWWAAFTVIPFLGLRDRPAPVVEAAVEPARGPASAAFIQLWHTLRDLRHYPQTLLFLAGYLFYNDGIQTVIYAATLFGEGQLRLGKSTMLVTVLVVQFVGFAGALLFGLLAGRIGARRAILLSLVLWCAVVTSGYFLPERRPVVFIVLGGFIGLVLGGSQALSRSLYSQLVPRGREAEYFSLYQATERGTSWTGTLLFGLISQILGSYRPAIVALVAWFLLGGGLLAAVRVRQGIEAAGNEVPAVV